MNPYDLEAVHQPSQKGYFRCKQCGDLVLPQNAGPHRERHVAEQHAKTMEEMAAREMSACEKARTACEQQFHRAEHAEFLLKEIRAQQKEDFQRADAAEQRLEAVRSYCELKRDELYRVPVALTKTGQVQLATVMKVLELIGADQLVAGTRAALQGERET